MASGLLPSQVALFISPAAAAASVSKFFPYHHLSLPAPAPGGDVALPMGLGEPAAWSRGVCGGGRKCGAGCAM